MWLNVVWYILFVVIIAGYLILLALAAVLLIGLGIHGAWRQQQMLATFQPAPARASAISRPRRFPAPVTSAVRGAAGGCVGGGRVMGDNGRVNTESVSEPSILASALLQRVKEAIAANGGWLR